MDAPDKLLRKLRLRLDGRNLATAYVLAVLLGLLGAHRFYLGRRQSGFAILFLTLSFFGLVVSGLWVLVDLFLIPGMVQANRDRHERRSAPDALAADADQRAPRRTPAE